MASLPPVQEGAVADKLPRHLIQLYRTKDIKGTTTEMSGRNRRMHGREAAGPTATRMLLGEGGDA